MGTNGKFDVAIAPTIAAWPRREPNATGASAVALPPHASFTDGPAPSPQASGAQPRSRWPLLSGATVVVPVYNSAETLRELVAQLAQVLPTCTAHYEVI